MQAFVGIDDGNYDVKTANTTTPGGYTTHKTLPAMTEEYLFFNGMYYVPDQERFDYQEDKTINDRCLILTLFGLAKELLYMTSKKEGDIQKRILSIDKVAIGAGLPPLQWHLRDKKLNYYQEKLGSKNIVFEYCHYQFNIIMNYCKLFPQAWAAIVNNKNNEIINNYNRFYAVDIGGGTLDVILFINGNPVASKCITENLGVLYMYQQIIYDVKRNFGKSIDNKDIENILGKKITVIPQPVKDEVYNGVQRWVDNKIINKLSQSKINFDSTPTIFLGGGSKLLQPYIDKNEIIKNQFYLKDAARANAKGYQALVKAMFKENA